MRAMHQHHALIETVVDEMIAGLRPPPTAAEIQDAVPDLPDAEDLSIGEVAEMFGILPTTIRYYESAGLLSVPRRAGGHRVFDRATLGELFLVHGMRLSDMPVREIARLRELLAGRTPAARESAAALLDDHARETRRRIAHLQIALAITEHKTAYLTGDTP